MHVIVQDPYQDPSWEGHGYVQVPVYRSNVVFLQSTLQLHAVHM